MYYKTRGAVTDTSLSLAGLSLLGRFHVGHSLVLEHPVAPVAYQVILEPGMGQCREFEPPRVHTRLNSLGLFLGAQIDLRKDRERELATLDENRRAVRLLNLFAIKIEGKNRGGEGTTPVTTACPEARK